MKKFLLLVCGLFLLTMLTGCPGDNGGSNGDETSTTEGGNDTGSVSDFIDMLDGDSYRYDFISTYNDGTDVETYNYTVIKNGDDNVIIYYDYYEEDTIRILNTGNVTYYIEEGMKEAMVYQRSEYGDLYGPNLFMFETFEGFSYLNADTSREMVGGVQTTCYEYDLYGMIYRYFVTDDNIVVKVEFSGEGETFSAEIQNFTTTVSDLTEFTVPTEDDGYEIFDYTEFYPE